MTDFIRAWFKENISSEKFNVMLNSLVIGDIEIFELLFSEFVMKSVSYFDISGEESEKVYHSFVLGMLVALCDDYFRHMKKINKSDCEVIFLIF